MSLRGNSTVLVVDDERDLRENIAEILEDEGYQTKQAANGAAALALARAVPHPNVILLDLMMPVMSGWQFRAAQLADPEIAGIPVIVVSAADPQGMNAWATVLKPYEVEALLSAVDRACVN